MSQCADKTNGTVNILHPSELIRQLRIISQNPTIASNVSVKFLMHPSLCFEGEADTGSCVLLKSIGNATRSSDISFKYKLKETRTDLTLKQVPFQVQVMYHLEDGSKCLRVIYIYPSFRSSPRTLRAEMAASTLLSSRWVLSRWRRLWQKRAGTGRPWSISRRQRLSCADRPLLCDRRRSTTSSCRR